MNAERLVRSMAEEIGVTINGPHPWDLQVHDQRFYARVLAGGSLGLGESYMDGWWDCDDLIELHTRIAESDVEDKTRRSWRARLKAWQAQIFNLQSVHRAPIVARRHYDVTVDHYRNMTDPWIALSCGYWKEARTQTEAQEAKLDLICKKLRLSKADRVLDIGCGFASFARFAGERYGCSVTAINISSQQVQEARALCKDLPITIHHCDYRDIPKLIGENGPFDRIVSIEMFEHVGHKNHRIYMEIAHRSLRDGGLFLLQTAGANVSNYQNDDWFDEYIFPNAVVPSVQQIGEAIAGLFVLEDWHNFGPDYVKTFCAWFEQFDRTWTRSRDDRFYRMWKYYLLAGAGGFKARRRQLWQLLLSKGGVKDPAATAHSR
jgi:cyclopropane-fatty-acyl-phospholipid synthase